MENYIFDIVLGVIAILIIAISAKRGFVISLLSTISVALSGFLSYKFSKPVAEFIYSSFLYDKIVSKLTEVISQYSVESSYKEKLQAMVDSLPEGLLNVSRGLGFNPDTAIESLELDVFTNEVIVKAFIDNFMSDIIKSLLEIVVLVIMFVLLSVVFRYVSMLLNKYVKKIPVVGKTNTILGGVLGMIKAGVLVIGICLVACPVIFAIDIPWLENTVSHSYIYGFIIENNIFTNFI